VIRRSPLVLAAMTMAAFSAHAADLPARVLPTTPIVAEPVFAPTWSGFTVGVNVGGAFEDRAPVDIVDGFGNRANIVTRNQDASSVTFGGGIGYNYQIGSVVFGLEGDYQYARLRARDSYFDRQDLGGWGMYNVTTQGSVKRTLDSFGTARGRLGFLVTPQFLLFGTGGLAFGDVSLSGSARSDLAYTPTGQVLGTIGPYGFKKSDFNIGWTAGGGVEYAVSPKWSVKAEALYVSLDRQTGYVPTEDFGTVRVSTRDREFVVGRLGVNYRW
jgi:outer membrane immunogenic protein